MLKWQSHLWILAAGGMVIFCLLAASGCSGPFKIVKKKTEKPFQQPPIPPPDTSGSLWEAENGRAFMFQDLRARRVGDIIIVKIVEKQKGSKTANTKADRDSSFKNNISGSFFGLHNFAPAFAKGLGVDLSSENKFKGEGSTSREDTLTGTIAAQVVEILPNGDLRITGNREVTVNSETQTMTLKGIVRRVDLDTTNTVLSSAIANAEITYTGLGVADDVQRPGWFIRVMDWLSPI